MPVRRHVASVLAVSVVVDGTRLAQHEVLGDLDGHDVGAEDVELDGQEKFF